MPQTAEEAAKAPIKMNQSLSSQAAQLTKLLQADKPAKETQPSKKDETAPETPKDAEASATKIDEPEKTPEERFIEPPAEELAPAPKPVELPEISKYVLDKLPTLQTRIKDGEQIKVVRFKDISELPAGFESASDADRAALTADIAAQVGRAKDAIAQYNQTKLNNQLAEWQAQEDKEVRADLARLQRRGIIPKFKYSDDDDRFNDDPAVQLSNKIYNLFKETNDAYRKANKTYRITYEDAADKYFARESRTKADDTQKAKEQPKSEKKKLTPAQKERQEIAKQQGAPNGSDADKTTTKPKVRSGMQMGDINKMVRMGVI
jgi:hypothetical protein